MFAMDKIKTSKGGEFEANEEGLEKAIDSLKTRCSKDVCVFRTEDGKCTFHGICDDKIN